MLELSLCNELLAEDGLSLAAQCERAAALGYRGLELAPGTLSARPHAMSGAEWRAVRETVEAAGLRVTGLHWLLSPYPGLSIFDPATHAETQAVLGGLIDGCAALGGDVLALCPPLVINEDEIGQMFDAVERTLERAEAWVAKDGLRNA